MPAINELLAPFGVAFGDAVLRGDLSVGGSAVQLASAAYARGMCAVASASYAGAQLTM